MDLQKFTFHVTGVSPLLMASPKGMGKQGKDDKKSKAKLGGNALEGDPKAEAEALCYRLSGGQLYGPADGLRSSLLSAAIGRTLTVDKKKITAWKVIAGSVFTVEDACPLIHPRTKKPITTYEIHSCRGVNPSTGGGIRLHRPMVKEWMTDLVLEIDTELMNLPLVEELFNIAGRIIGWMAFRPEKKGRFGRYQVALDAAAKKVA